MRLTALLSLLGLPLVPMASFDLMLIPQPGTNRIQRYDPVNQVTLGTFSTGVSANSYVAANNASSNCLVGGGTSAMVNYATGERGAVGSPGSLAVLHANGSTYSDVLSTSYRLGSISNLGILGGISTGLSSIYSMVNLNSSTVGILGRDAAGNIVIGSYSANSLTQITSFFTVIGAADVVAATNAGQMARFTTTSGASTSQRIGFVYRSVASGGYRLATLALNADGSLNNSLSPVFSSASLNFSTTAAATTVAAVAGHSNIFLVGADTGGTGTRFVEMTGSTGTTFGDQFVESGFTAPTGQRWSMANVVAPEPGTMAALGLGVAAVLKRRRR